MLLFTCTGEDGLLPTQLDAAPVRLWTRLERAEHECEQRILVVDSHVLGLAAAAPRASDELLHVQAVPAEAILNDRPYRRPRAVTAAGGYVVRPVPSEVEVLLIFRRGVWDLPKGKLDEGESVPECALREVREELGIDELRIRRPLGTTLHGYADGSVYSVKTTHWFLMETREERFVPQTEEQIEKVVWVPWNEAKQLVGYETLRDHMQRIEATVLSSAIHP